MAHDVVVVDGRPGVHEFMVRVLADAGYIVHSFRSRATFLRELPAFDAPVVLLGADEDVLYASSPLTLDILDVTVRLTLHILTKARRESSVRLILFHSEPERLDPGITALARGAPTLPWPVSEEALLQAVSDVGVRDEVTGR